MKNKYLIAILILFSNISVKAYALTPEQAAFLRAKMPMARPVSTPPPVSSPPPQVEPIVVPNPTPTPTPQFMPTEELGLIEKKVNGKMVTEEAKK